MEERDKENVIINEDENQNIEQNSINNPIPNEESDNKNNIETSPPILNPQEEENKIKKEEEIIISDESKNMINNNIMNKNLINNNIQKNNLINNNFLFDFPNIKKKEKVLNLDNLSSEEKAEKIQNFLHTLLSEVSSIKEKGNEYYKNKNYNEAEAQYQEGINKISESPIFQDIEEFNGQINNYLMSINSLNLQLYNNLSATYIKQQKYEETIKNCEFIIQHLNQEHVVSYCRILFALIELKKVITANHYAEIIKKKFGNETCFSKFQEQFANLEKLNKEFSDKILNQNPEIKKEVISINDNLNKEKEIDKEEENKVKKYMPFILGGAFIFLVAGGRFLYRKFKDK